jgi:hypothetical protein
MAAAQLLGGLAYAVGRGRARPLDWRVAAALAFPMAWDVGSQMLGLRSSSWPVRSATGGLATLAFVFWAYPVLDDVLRRLSEVAATDA